MRRLAFYAVYFALLFLPAVNLFAQVAGQNINMVSGTQWPGGDPFLQRQNEPSFAVSTRNPEHLLAGANDYRTVDIANPQSADETHDAWLGVFTSMDGGETWRSILLPGYPQDNSPTGVASPLHNYTVATDPTVRAGTHGLFYYSGLVFNRGSNAPSGVFIATFQDQNNKSSGNKAIQQIKNGAGNPFQYLNAAIVDSGTSGQFLDKPWIAVDIPRTGRTATCNVNGQTIQSGYVYLFYTQFTGSKVNPTSKIKVVTSSNCGASWSKPLVLSQSAKLNQGTVAAVDPGTGTVYVAWRQLATGSNQPDAIQYAYSSNGGSTFSIPPPAYTFPVGGGFDQPQGSSNTFRDVDLPALAVDGSGRLWLAFSQRVTGPNGTYGSRIMMTTLPRGGKAWTAPYIADGSVLNPAPLPAGDQAPPVWHQFMPSLSFAYGRLMLAYYDTRWDNQRSVLACDQPPCTSLSQLTPHHQFIPGSGLFSSAGFSAVFGPSISDPIPGIRHTIDVFGGVIDPAQFNGSPLRVPAIQISQYAYWENPSDNNQIEQGFYNPPNLPLFVQGTIPFIGDYIDVAALSMTLSGGSWKFNTQATDAPVFHVTWTDNRDVVPPPCVGGDLQHCTEDWTQFVPPNGGNLVPSMYSSVANVCPTCTTMQPVCNTANSGYSGDRNQNIYTSRITSGLMVRFRENSKRLGSRRAFSLLVRNTKSPLSTTPLGTPSFYRIMLNPSGTPPVASCAIAGGTAAFPDGSCQLDIAINPKTTATRNINVNSTNLTAGVSVLVSQITGLNGTFTPNGLTASAVLNADATNPALADSDSFSADNSFPDQSTPYGIPLATGEVYDPSVDGPGINAPGINAPGINAPGINAPAINAPGINAPGIVNSANNAPGINSPGIVSVPTNAPGITSIQTVNPTVNVAANAPGINAPGINAPGINAPGINAPGIVNLDYFAPSITNLQDGNVTDYTWRATNKGNTSSSYNAKEFAKATGVTCCDGSGNPSGCSRCQLIAHKVYNSPTANGTTGNLTCDLTVQQQSITVANIPDPSAFTTNGSASNDGSETNPSISLASGEGNRLTLRVQAPIFTNQLQVFPFKAIAAGFTNDFNNNAATSLVVSTVALPVALVGQNYAGSQLTALGGFGAKAWTIPADPSQPQAVSLPTGPATLPVTPLTLNQAGQISTQVVTASPGTYNFYTQVQDAASTQALDVQNLNFLVNKFSISGVSAASQLTGSSTYLKKGDTAVVTVTVQNDGPADASNIAASLAYAATAGGTQADTSPPSLACNTPAAAAFLSGGGSQQAFIFSCSVFGGNGTVVFTGSATASYVNNPAAAVLATALPGPTAQINVDTTLPTLTLASVTVPGAQPGTTQPYTPGNWTNQHVTVTYNCVDNFSGVAAGSPLITVLNPSGPVGSIVVTDLLHASAAVTASAESSNTSVSSACQDVAGNAGTPPATVSPIMIDHTKPVITAGAVSGNTAYLPGSWTNQDVTVTYTCTDNLSGPLHLHPVITEFPNAVIAQVSALVTTATATLSAETSGTTLHATCSDNATNAGDGLAFGPIMIDKTAPMLTASAVSGASAHPYASGTWTNQNVSVVYACVDNLSPQSVNSGVAAGSPTAPQTFIQETSNGSAAGSCLDNAGNVANVLFAPIMIDKTSPVLSASAAAGGAPYTAGNWANQDVTVTYTCTDERSGPAATYPLISGLPDGVTPILTAGALSSTAAATLTAETSGVTLNASCLDNSTNAATSLSFGPVKIDRTAPAVTGSAITGGSPYTAGGWTHQPVTVSFACADTLSGPDLLSITGNTTIETQQTTTADGSCKDLAGNQGTGSFGPINIDTTGPAIVVVSPQNGQFFVLNQQITPDFTCVEGAGGIDAAACTITPSADPYAATPLGPGTFSVNATDDAGNSASASVQYSVIYKFTGFLAPLQAAGTNSDSGNFSVGNIIPVEWQLQDAGDVYFSDLATLRTIQAFPNATCSGGPAGTGTALYDSSNGTGQLAFSYDMPNSRFVFNWDTTGLSAGCYNLVVTPDDATANNTLVHLQ